MRMLHKSTKIVENFQSNQPFSEPKLCKNTPLYERVLWKHTLGGAPEDDDDE